MGEGGAAGKAGAVQADGASVCAGEREAGAFGTASDYRVLLEYQG